MYLYFLSLPTTIRVQSSGSPLPPSLHPSTHSSAAPSGLNTEWMDGGNEGGKWMDVWRRRSIGYYHQHTLKKKTVWK